MNFDQSLVERLVRMLMPKKDSDPVSEFLLKLRPLFPRIVQLKATSISPSPKSQLEGNALFINGIYTPFKLSVDANKILESYRNDASAIIQNLAKQSFKGDFIATYISFYELPKKGNIRVYRTHINNDGLDHLDQISREIILNEMSFHPRLIERFKDKFISQKK